MIEEQKTLLTLRAPLDASDDGFHEHIRILRYSVGKFFTVNEVLRRQKSNTGRFKLVGEGKVTGAKVPMAWIAVTPKSPKDESDDLVKIDFITTKGTDIVVVTAMTESDVWKTYLPIFTTIASSLAPASENDS